MRISLIYSTLFYELNTHQSKSNLIKKSIITIKDYIIDLLV